MSSREDSNLVSRALSFWNSIQYSYTPISATSNRSPRPPQTPQIPRGAQGSPGTSNFQSFNNRYDKALEEIKRYEDFTTIDWVQDAIHERSRMNALRNAAIENRSSWSTWLRLSYEASQSWIVVSIVGAFIGLNAALIDIITEWLSDIKSGYCKNSWWLNQKFCCWEIEGEDDSCELWHDWSQYNIINWFFYVAFATLFAAVCAFMIRAFAPYAAGSGISEIKCILAGFVMKGFLGGRTLLLKSVCLPLAIASGLSIGKEGPSVHTAACVGNIVSRLFKRNKAKMREILSASCAAGVAVAFGSPIGGVLFSFEEMSSNFPMKTLWRSFFCALVATVVLQGMNPFRTGKLVMFHVTYDREWHFFEIIFFIILGVFGGLYGALVIKYNIKVQHFRKKYLRGYGVAEASALAFITALIGYFNIFMKLDMTETLGILFQECESKTHDYENLCVDSQTSRMARLLLIATILRTGFVIISYGTKVPAGIFIPSMAVGATFGRFLGLCVKALQNSYPEFPLFATCKPDTAVSTYFLFIKIMLVVANLALVCKCVTPGMYAFLGAAAALSGVMHLTVCVVVIMFELTGALTYILPTMITLMVTKAVGGLHTADQMIRLNGFPFLDKEEYSFGVSVATVMRKKGLAVMPAIGKRLEKIDEMLLDTNYQGFPVVQDEQSMTLLGYIGRVELKYAIGNNIAKRLRGTSNDAHCFFNPEDNFSDHDNSGESSSNFIDFGPFIDQTPITVHPKLPLETVMDLFKKMGLALVGLITVKDVLKYIARKEAEEGKDVTDLELTNNDIDDSNSNSFGLVGRKRGINLIDLGKRRENDL
ncbi:7067_t:CDS:10 [Funneliformis mosseae]|uniref:7067_t:CDS:1 n=1 Tax=Funneliformis mosseae TaxID=27381 RepID=A0A9N8ZJ62_FUNMO|nr:7067_t:CDS:10 [Funneliformis mosseae]